MERVGERKRVKMTFDSKTSAGWKLFLIVEVLKFINKFGNLMKLYFVNFMRLILCCFGMELLEA